MALRGSVGIRIFLGGTTSTAFGTNAIMQTYDVERSGDEIEIKDGTGKVVAWNGENKKKEATFTYYVGGTAADSASALVAPEFGDLITVTQTFTNKSLPTGSNWIVKNVNEAGTNNDAVKVTVKATAYDGITS
jgi:hypothetical protein